MLPEKLFREVSPVENRHEPHVWRPIPWMREKAMVFYRDPDAAGDPP
jgi:hypothetical protein